MVLLRSHKETKSRNRCLVPVTGELLLLKWDERKEYRFQTGKSDSDGEMDACLRGREGEGVGVEEAGMAAT